MFWILASWLEKFGVEVGYVIIFLPVINDILGVYYGRDNHLKIGAWGILCQIIGGTMMLLGKYARRWGRK
jgi:hypothetical protein